MESREALRICSQALPGRDTGRTDLDGNEAPTLSLSGSRTQRDLPLPHGEWGSGQSPENGSRDQSLGCRGKAHALRSIILSMAKTLGKFLETRALRQGIGRTQLCVRHQIAGRQSLQFYVSKPFSPPETVDTKASKLSNCRKSEHKVPEKALNCGFYAVSRVRRLLVAYAGADTSHP